MSLDTQLPELPDPIHPVARDQSNQLQVYIDADWYPVLKALVEAMKEVQAEIMFTSAVADLGSAAVAGRLAFVSDGRKVGEGAGLGTGTVAYSDGVQWRRVADDTTVAA